MICSSSLADDPIPLVLDTSVLINLHACSFGEKILAAIPNVIVVPEIVRKELGHETSRINGEHRFLEDLLTRQQIHLSSLDDDGWAIFEKLTTTSPSLGDGEAATIATAAINAYRPVIDDAKGRKRALELSQITAAWSLDLLIHPDVRDGLENEGYIEAVYLALRDGRMRIDEERCDSVVRLIGTARALQCPSLPGFKARREHWEKAIKRMDGAR